MVRKSSLGLWLMILTGFLVAGCGEPPPMITMTPPGIESNFLPKEAEEETAQAIGEGINLRANPNVADSEDERISIDAPATDPREPTEPGERRETETGLKYETLKPGKGHVAHLGDEVIVHYTGYVDVDGEKGPQFDSSRGRQPASFFLNPGRLIQGWIEGVPGMRTGETRLLIIPPELGYGSQGQEKIPPNSTLIFEIELLGVQH